MICASVLETIKQNSDVIEFEAAYSEAFRSLEAQLYDLLIDGQIENVQALKLEITKVIYSRNLSI